MNNEKTDNLTPEEKPQSSQGASINLYDKDTRRLAFISILISALSLLFGDGIVKDLYRLVREQQSQPLNVDIPEGIIASLNIILAAFVIWDPKTRRLTDSIMTGSNSDEASDSFKQLIFGWRLVWLTWLLLYVWLAAGWFGGLWFVGPKAKWYVADGLNMLNGFFFYYLFFVLDQRSVKTPAKPNRTPRFYTSVITVLILGAIAFSVSALVDYWWNPLDAQGRVEDILVRKLVGGYTALGMAFFFGRLDSHYLDAPRVVLAPLYLYVIIQLLWGRIETENTSVAMDTERVVILILALVFKFVVFKTVSKWLRNGSLYDYLIKVEEGQVMLESKNTSPSNKSFVPTAN